MFEDNQKPFGFQEETLSWWWSFKEEVVGIALTATFFFCTVACISFNPKDHSYFYFSHGTNVSNWCGAVGAELAAFMFYCFGSVTYLVLGLLLFLALFLLSSLSLRHQWLRLVSYTMVIPVSATLSHIYHFDVTNSIPGGLLGYLATRQLTPLLHPLGMRVVLWALFGMAVMGLVQISVVNAIIGAMVGAVKGVGAFFSTIALGMRTVVNSIVAGTVSVWQSLCFVAATVKKTVMFVVTSTQAVASTTARTTCWLGSFVYRRKRPIAFEQEDATQESVHSTSYNWLHLLCEKQGDRTTKQAE